MDGLLIRPAAWSDLEAIAPLAGSPQRARVRLQAADHGGDSMVVAVLPPRVVGVVSIRWRHGCDPPHPWLYGLHVAATCRRQGVGRALMGAAEDLARRRGVDCLSLDVDTDDDTAQSFYAALGYTFVRPHNHRWRSIDPSTGAVLSEGVVPTLVMERSLNQ